MKLASCPWQGILLLFLSLCLPIQADNIPITSAAATETQIVLTYMVTSSAPCTISVTDENGGINPPHDVNSAFFPGANVDLARTTASGFRWPTIVNSDGLMRTVVLGGHDEIKLASDGKWYSTALQVNSPHAITVTCNGGADTGTVEASTANLPVASYYPEMPIPAPGSSLGGLPQPTIDWSRAGRETKYMDPVTGILIKRITGGSDYFDDTNPLAGRFQPTVLDVNGPAWTNPNNLTTNQSSGTLSTTSTPNAPLFAAFDPSFVVPGQEVLTDILVTPYGSGDSPQVISEWCLSLDSGQSCANFTPVDVTMAMSARAYSKIPSVSPASFFADWGGMRVAHGSLDMTNQSFGGVSASGNAVTIDSPNYPGGSIFYMGLAPGSKFTLTGCSAGTQAAPLTVATVNSPGSITTVEAGLSLAGCTYTDMHAGVRVILKNAGTLHVSFQAQGWQARAYSGGTSGSRYYCAKSKVTDIQTDCDGVTHSPPLSGYLCQFPAILSVVSVFLVQDNGRMCLQSDLYSATAPGHLEVDFPSWVDNKSLLGVTFGSQKHLWKATHIVNDYTEMPDDPIHTKDTKMVYTDLGLAAPDTSQIVALGGPVAEAVRSGIWPAFGFESITEDKNGNPILQYNSQFGQNTLCQKAFSTIDGTVLSTMPGYGSYPLSYTACHSAPTGGGGYVVVGTQGDDSTLAPARFSTAQTLGGPFASNVIAVRKNGSWVQTSIPITSCTNASPAVCTATGNNLDNVSGLSSTAGSWMTISGATGAGLYAHRIDNDTFSLYTDPQGAVPLDSTGLGTLGGTITATVARPIYSLRVNSVTNAGGNARITIDTSLGGEQRYYPSIAATGITNIVFDADPITIVPTYLNSTTQYYAKVSCAGCSNSQFDVYADAALSSPVAFSTLSGAAGWYVLYAETCPDPASVTLPGAMYTDTGFGTTGAGNQKVRCVGIRLNSEMESNFAASAEHAAYPPPPSSAEASSASKSMLHRINAGDGIMDLSHITGNHEIMYTLAVDRSAGENQIDVIVERFYGDDPNFGWRGVTNGPSRDQYAGQHSPGWTATGTGVVGLVMFDPTTQAPIYFVPPVNGAHFDLVTGSTPGTLTSASGYPPGSPDDLINVPIDTYINTLTSTHNSVPTFGGGTSYSWSGLKQSYPSRRTIVSQTPSASEQAWKGDWAAPNIDYGAGKNALDGGFSNRALRNVSGIVWQIQPLSAINIKLSPLYAAAAPYNYFADKSGPSSALGSRNNGKFCYAYNDGECVGGSSAGDFYIAATTLQSTGAASTQCFANDATYGSPCAFGLWPGMGWALQIRQTPVDINATGVRRLTTGFWPVLGQYYAYNWVASPDGKWGFFAGNPLNQRPKHNEEAANFFAMKLPPWPDPIPIPGVDGLSPDRTTFIPYPVQVWGQSGDTVRIAFGYGENGDIYNSYCTTRLETCWTSDAATSSNPYLFDSEPQSRTKCDSACTIQVPAIAGRVLYYRIEHADGTTGPIRAVAIP